MGAATSALLMGHHAPGSKGCTQKGAAMDINTITFAAVIVALGIGGVIVYLKGK